MGAAWGTPTSDTRPLPNVKTSDPRSAPGPPRMKRLIMTAEPARARSPIRINRDAQTHHVHRCLRALHPHPVHLQRHPPASPNPSPRHSTTPYCAPGTSPSSTPDLATIAVDESTFSDRGTISIFRLPCLREALLVASYTQLRIRTTPRMR
jgi:hypothetical protein